MSTTKEFDRSICFTFFEDYRTTARELENDFGKEIVAEYYNTLADYALYGVIPELSGALKYIWPTTKTTLDKSIDRRANGFSRENTEQTEKVLAYKREQPDATQKQIAEATGISVGKVNKVLKSYADTFADTNTSTVSNPNTTRERECEHTSLMDANAENEKKSRTSKKRGLEELTDEELESIRADFSKRVDYKATRERLGLNRQVSKEMQKEVDEILSQRKALAKNAEIKGQFSALSDSNVVRIADYLNCEKEDVIDNLSFIGVTADYFLEWLDDGHADSFSIDGSVWEKECEDGNPQYKTYIDFVKMGVVANPVGVKHNFLW